MYLRGSGNGRPYQRTTSLWGNRAASSSKTPSSPAPPLGPLIRSLKSAELSDDARKFADSAIITDCTPVASFSWLDKPKPTILVPGRPPRWTPLSVPEEIPDDNGFKGNPHWSRGSNRRCFRDQNAARYPKHPMEPAVLAALRVAPEKVCGDDKQSMIDVVACSSTLGNLLRFIMGQDKLFRMLVEEVKGSVFFIRRENSPTEVIPDVQGYGHSFPDHYTTWDWDVKGSKSHQRIVRYRFGGMQLLVRFATDGYIAKDPPKLSMQKKTDESTADNMPLMTDLLKSLDAARISSAKPTSEESSELQLESAGEMIDQSLIFDLKTRSVKKIDQDTLGQEMPRLWASQIPKFILAYHRRGVFDDIRVMDVADKVKEWEETNSTVLAKLAALIHRVTKMLADRPDGKLEICHSQVGTLEIREQLPDAGDVLSPAVKAMWSNPGSKAKRGGKTEPEADWIDDDGDNSTAYSPQWEGRVGFDWHDEESEVLDFTACSSESCGYCGRCDY